MLEGWNSCKMGEPEVKNYVLTKQVYRFQATEKSAIPSSSQESLESDEDEAEDLDSNNPLRELVNFSRKKKRFSLFGSLQNDKDVPVFVNKAEETATSLVRGRVTLFDPDILDGVNLLPGSPSVTQLYQGTKVTRLPMKELLNLYSILSIFCHVSLLVLNITAICMSFLDKLYSLPIFAASIIAYMVIIVECHHSETLAVINNIMGSTQANNYIDQQRKTKPFFSLEVQAFRFKHQEENSSEKEEEKEEEVGKENEGKNKKNEEKKESEGRKEKNEEKKGKKEKERRNEKEEEEEVIRDFLTGKDVGNSLLFFMNKESKFVNFTVLADASGELNTFLGPDITKVFLGSTIGFLNTKSQKLYEDEKRKIVAEKGQSDMYVQCTESMHMPGMEDHITVFNDAKLSLHLLISRPAFWMASILLLTWPYRIWFARKTRLMRFTLIKLLAYDTNCHYRLQKDMEDIDEIEV